LQFCLNNSTSFKFLDNKATYSTQLSGALSKGQFTRNEFNGIEGNQGPYTLVGAQGEQFIIVLAGTEKLFIDGARLERGFNKDYTIDYNSGEIIFTPNQLITQDKRIVVEFEYSTQEYTRSLVSWNNDISYKNWDINFQLYTEQDGRRPTSLSSLTDEQLNVLETIGDSTAFLPSLELFDPANDSQLQSTYIQIDTTVNGVTFEDILFATKTGEPLFTARFSEVGFGKGDYLLNASSVNGRTYRWVAPINGVPQGNFEPRVQVAPPEQRQLAILGVNRKLGKNGNVKNEIALSNQDLNRFSDVNDDDNVGFANKFIFNNTWNTFPKKKIALETNFQHEFLSDNFNALNTFRTYEFNRDWNLSNEEAAIAKQENWVTLQNKVLFPLGNIGYSISGFLKDSIYEGLNQEISTVIDKKKFHLEASSSFLQSTNLSEETSFIRPEHDIYQSFPKLGNITLGFKSLGEYNRRTNIGLDTLNSFSNGFQQWDVYLKKAVSKELDFSINLQQRDNFLPVASDLETSTSSFNVSLLGNWRKKKSNLKWNLTYRDLKVNDQITTSIEDQETYLGRIQHQLSSKKNFIKLNTVYEIGGGQDQVLDFDFIEVPAGLGNFLWVDRNNNGIQEEEEFEIAPAFLSDSAQFIRVTNFTNDFVQTNDVDFIQSLNLNLSKLEKAPAFLKRFSTIIKGQIDRRTRASEEDLSVWNPFIFEIGESSLIRQTNSLRSTLFFNKSNKKYALDFGHLTSSNQRLQTTGFESQVNTTSFQRLRWNIHKNVILRNEFQSTRRENNSELSSTRNFLITGLNSAPELTLFISKKLRGNIGYEWKNDFNDIGNESLLQNSIDTEWTWNKSDKTNVRLSGSFIQADFEGTENTPVSFALLNGLQPGNNFLWNIDINKFLSKNIILNIRYEGRKTGENPIVHLGSMSVRASF